LADIKRAVEKLSGSGSIGKEGEQQYQVKYELTVYRKFIVAGSEELPSSHSVQGTIAGISAEMMFDCLGQILILTMRDSRKVQGLFIDSNGHFQGTGPIYD